MEKDPELDQVLSNALSLQEDYPDIYLPPSDKDMNDIATFSKIPLDLEIQKPLNEPNGLQETLVDLYSILGIPHEPLIMRSFNTGSDQSVPSIARPGEQLSEQHANNIKRLMSEEEMGIFKRTKEEKEDHFPSASSQKSRKRTLYDKQQTLFLQKQFDLNPYPDYVSRCCFAQVWFQNRRARYLNKSSQEAVSAISMGGQPLTAWEVPLCQDLSTIQTGNNDGHPS